MITRIGRIRVAEPELRAMCMSVPGYNHQRWRAFKGTPLGFVVGLPTFSRPSDQFTMDVRGMCRLLGALVGVQEHPLVTWLRNMAEIWPDVGFRVVLDRVMGVPDVPPYVMTSDDELVRRLPSVRRGLSAPGGVKRGKGRRPMRRWRNRMRSGVLHAQRAYHDAGLDVAVRMDGVRKVVVLARKGASR